MTDLDKAINAMRAAKKENSVDCVAPEIKRTYTYRKTTKIYAHDLKN